MKRHGIRYLLYAFSALLTLVAVMMVILAIRDRRLTWESLVRLTGPNSVSKREGLLYFYVFPECKQVFELRARRGQKPPEILADLLTREDLDAYRKEYGAPPRNAPRYVLPNSDPWGNPFHYEVQDLHNGFFIVFIGTAGGNGRDDGDLAGAHAAMHSFWWKPNDPRPPRNGDDLHKIFFVYVEPEKASGSDSAK